MSVLLQQVSSNVYANLTQTNFAGPLRLSSNNDNTTGLTVAKNGASYLKPESCKTIFKCLVNKTNDAK